jgi:UDP-glucose 4-epimerase
MTVYAVTGASGYIAGRVIRMLVELPDCEKIMGLDIKPPVEELPGLEFHVRDVRDPGIARLFRDENVKKVLHFAFVLNPIHDSNLMREININGTKNILEAALAAGAEQVLATSSTSAYGWHPDNPVPLKEDHPLRAEPDLQYAHDKKDMDLLLQEFAAAHPEIRITIFRPCIVVGPGFENFISRALNLPINLKVGGANPPLQFVHEDDVARAAILAVQAGRPGIFNIVGEGKLTLDEVAAMKDRLITLNFPTWIIYPLVRIAWRIHLPGVEYPVGAIGSFRFPWVADGTKAKQELGFTPRYSTRDVWQNFLDFRRENPKTPLQVWRKKRIEKRAYREAKEKGISYNKK